MIVGPGPQGPPNKLSDLLLGIGAWAGLGFVLWLYDKTIKGNDKRKRN